MKKTRSERYRRKTPTAASLKAVPAVDFARYAMRRNPWAAGIRRHGVQLVHDAPSAASLVEMPEADFTRLRARGNPYVSRAAEALARMQYGRGRPRRGRELGPTPARSVRLPEAVWDALDAEARRTGTTVHALLRRAIADYLRRTAG